MERWKAIPDFPGYEVSDLGRVRSVARACRAPQCGGERRVPEKILKGSAWGPYLAVTLFSDGERVRRNIQWLVLETFVGPRPGGKEACHNNGKPHDNRLENLRWDTRSGNFADKVLHGTHQRGERHGRAKLAEADARAIKSLKGQVAQREIAAWFGMSESAVGMIQSGRTWRHL